MADATKPVKLQVNQSGSWRNVIAFDAGDDGASTEVLAAADQLARAIAGASFRIVMGDGGRSPEVLLRWSKEHGWKETP